MHKAPDRVQPYNQKWEFGVEIAGFNWGSFSKCDLPEFEHELSTFASAGSMQDQKFAGRNKFPPVTLEKGVITDGSDLAIWFQMAVQANSISQTGNIPENYLFDFDIVEFARTGQPIRRWRFEQGFISKGKPGAHEGGSSEVAVETMTIEYFRGGLVDPTGMSGDSPTDIIPTPVQMNYPPNGPRTIQTNANGSITNFNP